MKKKLISVLVLLFLVSAPAAVQAQFLKKLKNKVEKKLDEVLDTDDQDKVNDDEADDSSDSGYDASEYEADYGEFVAGKTVVFKDMPGNDEIKGQFPSKWRLFYSRKSDNTEIVEVNGEKMIRLAKKQGISPLIPGKEKDYIPDSFTLEFDASFSTNAPDQRYYLNFYDLENQNDFVEYDVRDSELTLTTFGVTDNRTEGTMKGHKIFQESSTPVWRHIAVTYSNQNIEVYYDGVHIFHLGEAKGNFIGINISRSEFGTDDRYIKNVIIATNQ
ncbi:MAG: hypothetical protein DSY82_00480 [Flavobacteriia bacterium]|nr:MAG: hypothetical protein DSY82_00480 [Flavobacteriia bacterium]